MDALDLRKAPPRSPRLQLGGLYMLARTIDKVRATLPGGHLGEYQMQGFSAILLETLGLQEDDLRAVVALARGDDEVVEWVHRHSDPARYAELNERLSSITVADRIDRPGWLDRYPGARALPPETTLLEMLDFDDARSYAR